MIVGQLGKMTGTTVEGDNLVAQLRSFASVVDDTHLLTLAVGAGRWACCWSSTSSDRGGRRP